MRSALNCANLRFLYAESGSNPSPQCKVRTRAGHAVAFNPASAVKSLFNYTATDPALHTPVNRVIFYNGTNVKTYDVLTDTIYNYSPAITISALKLSVAEAGTRAYIAAYNANGASTNQGYVVDTSNISEKLFEPPPTTANVTITPTETIAGSVTAGDHKIALVVTTNDGYTTRPGPVNSGTAVFAPVPFTSTGSKNIHLVVSGTWSAASASISILMSPITDPDTYYFVANATAAVPGGSPFSVNIDIDIADEALINSPPAIDYFSLLSQDPITRSGPFNPTFVVTYKNRMVYGAVDRIYISEPFNYQWITADQHVQFLPGLQTIFGAFPYRDGNLYLESAEGTYTLADSGDKPSSWAGPVLIAGGIGTTAQAALNRDPSADTAWVPGPTGLRAFTNGSYGDPPLSFWTPDWGRINWAAAATIELIDDLVNQTVRVLVPLDAATSPSHEMTFDYKSGKAPETIRYSLNTAPGRFCFAHVLNGTTNKPEVWLGPAASGTVWRKDNTLIDDVGAAITGQVYETQRILDIEEMTGSQSFHGADYTAKGTAVLTLIGFGPDHNKQTAPKETDLADWGAQKPGRRIYRQWLLNAENQSLQFSADAGWFELTEAESYWSPYLRQT